MGRFKRRGATITSGCKIRTACRSRFSSRPRQGNDRQPGGEKTAARRRVNAAHECRALARRQDEFLKELRMPEIIDLSQEIYTGMPVFPGLPEVAITMHVSHEEWDGI